MAAFLILKKKNQIFQWEAKNPPVTRRIWEVPIFIDNNLEPLTLLCFDLYLVNFEMSIHFLSVS